MTAKDSRKSLRAILDESDFLPLPGVYDCLSARIAEEAGFKAIFLSGGALAYSRLGRPDIGFLSMGDFADAISNIVSSVDIPLIADADNGFGNAIHAGNTAKYFEQVGASGLQIDDKVLPGRTPSLDEVVSWDEIAPKIKAIRNDVSDDFVIVFRTVAHLFDYGIDEAINRINKAAECGADYAYIDGIKSMEELEKVSEKANIKLIANLNEKGFSGSLAIDEIKKLNYKVGLFPTSSLLGAAKTMIEIMETLYKEESTISKRDLLCEPKVVFKMMGLYSLPEKYNKYYE